MCCIIGDMCCVIGGISIGGMCCIGLYFCILSVHFVYTCLCPTQVSTVVFKYMCMEKESIHGQTTIFLKPIKHRLSTAVSTYVEPQYSMCQTPPSPVEWFISVFFMTTSGEATRLQDHEDRDEPRKKPPREMTTFTDFPLPTASFSPIDTTG